MNNPDAVRNIASRPPSAKKTANAWEACCPAREDRHASLSIITSDGARELIRHLRVTEQLAGKDSVSAHILRRELKSRRGSMRLSQEYKRCKYNRVN